VTSNGFPDIGAGRSRVKRILDRTERDGEAEVGDKGRQVKD
jgi:hypothetical protein